MFSSCGGGEEKNPFSVKSEVVTLANRPRALEFAPDGRLFFAEHYTGDIRIVTAQGALLPGPFAHIDVQANSEWGLTGLALDPNFTTNHFVYALFTAPVESDPQHPIATVKLIRFTEDNNRSGSPTVLINDFPDTQFNHHGFKANGSLHFGPDGFLYVTIGDYDYGKSSGPKGEVVSQDLGLPLGKMLRIRKEDGTAAPDNPFVGQPDHDSRIYAYGFNQGADFVFHPQTGLLYSTDNTISCEELNVVKAGGNYGYPNVGEFPFPDCNAGEQTKGIYFLAREGQRPGDFLSSVGAAGMEFASAKVYPLIGDSLLVCESVTGLMQRLVLAGPGFDQVTQQDVVVKDCKFDITTSPDGVIYYSNDTEIRRLIPVAVSPEAGTK